MKCIINLAIIFLFILSALPVKGLSFSISSASGNLGDQITVAVTTDDFADIISMQGSIIFDPEFCEFEQLKNFAFNDLSNANFGFEYINQGKLIFSWNDTDLTGESLENGSFLYEIVFTLTGNSGGLSEISFQNSPVVLEVINSDFEIVPTNYQSGIIQIDEFSQIPVSINFNSVTANLGDIITLHVTANEFVNIISLQGSIIFDADIIEFKSITAENLQNFTNDNFGTATANIGEIIFSWNDESLTGQTLSNNEILLTMRCEIIGNPGEESSVNLSDSPLSLECINSQFQNCELTTIGGSISINSQITDPILFSVADAVGDMGIEISIPVTVSNFSNIISMQGSILFDPQILNLIEITEFGLSGFSESNFGLNHLSEGIIIFSWNDASLEGETLDNEAVMLNLKFEILTNAVSETFIEIVNQPTSIEIVNSDFMTIETIITAGTILIIENQAPQLTQIPDQSIEIDETFAEIHLNSFVTDDYTLDENIQWTVSESSILNISIDNQIITTAVIDNHWVGEESIIFTATDEFGLSSQITIVFSVSYVTSISDFNNSINIYQKTKDQYLYIEHFDFDYSIDLFTISGRKIGTYYNSPRNIFLRPDLKNTVIIVRINNQTDFYYKKLYIR